MRKNVFGRQFKRDKNQRKALFKSLLSSLIIYERIKTTHEKAKAIKGQADKLITKAKKGGTRAYHLLEPELSHEAIEKLINEIAPRFIERHGGYTRITKLGTRGKDNASMALMEWTTLGSKFMQVAKTGEIVVGATEKLTQPKKQLEKKEQKIEAPNPGVQQLQKPVKKRTILPTIKTRQKTGDK